MLSGGERGRYALLRLLLHPANFLLLDEPTNHLDLRAKDVLLDALMKYTGTVVFVSHDRYFIDKLATRVFEVGGGKVEVFPGNYEDYLWRKQGGQHVAPTLDDVPGRSVAKASRPHVKPQAAVTANGNGTVRPAAIGCTEKTPESDQAQANGRSVPNWKRISAVSKTRSRICETALQNFVNAEESQRQSDELNRYKSSHATLVENAEKSKELEPSE